MNKTLKIVVIAISSLAIVVAIAFGITKYKRYKSHQEQTERAEELKTYAVNSVKAIAKTNGVEIVTFNDLRTYSRGNVLRGEVVVMDGGKVSKGEFCYIRYYANGGIGEIKRADIKHCANFFYDGTEDR